MVKNKKRRMYNSCKYREYKLTKKEREALKKVEPVGGLYVIAKLHKPYGTELFA
jgi:hypothetical protein